MHIALSDTNVQNALSIDCIDTNVQTALGTMVSGKKQPYHCSHICPTFVPPAVAQLLVLMNNW